LGLATASHHRGIGTELPPRCVVPQGPALPKFKKWFHVAEWGGNTQPGICSSSSIRCPDQTARPSLLKSFGRSNARNSRSRGRPARTGLSTRNVRCAVSDFTLTLALVKREPMTGTPVTCEMKYLLVMHQLTTGGLPRAFHSITNWQCADVALGGKRESLALPRTLIRHFIAFNPAFSDRVCRFKSCGGHHSIFSR